MLSEPVVRLGASTFTLGQALVFGALLLAALFVLLVMSLWRSAKARAVAAAEAADHARDTEARMADILQAPVELLKGHPGSSLGAAWAAAVGTGAVDGWAGISAFVRHGETLQPNRANAAVYEAGYHRFRDIYECLRQLPRGGRHDD